MRLVKYIFLLPTFLAIVLSCGPRPGSLQKLERNGIPYQQGDYVIKLSDTANHRAFIQYLGCGGVNIVQGTDRILIDPFFSNQSLTKITKSLVFGNSISGRRAFQSNEKAIDKGLDKIQRFKRNANQQTRAIFSSHSHYDHLMDIPAVWKKLEEKPLVYLNQSGYNTCVNVIDNTSMKVLENYNSTFDAIHDPVVIARDDGSKINVYPIASDHNPHFKYIKFFSGSRTTPFKEFNDPYQKTKANDWLEGNTFSFLIDYLDPNGSINLRLFIQSSSCNPPAGIPPQVLRKRRVDVALLGVVSYHFSTDYPCNLLEAINPKEIIWIHWEDFFRKYNFKPKTVRGTDIPKFFEKECTKAYKSKANIPWPGVGIEIKY